MADIMVKMRKTTITASDESDALNQAARQLDAAPDNIRITPTSPDNYIAQLINADAEIEFAIPKSNLQAIVKSYAPVLGTGAELSKERLDQAITAAGITHGIIPEELNNILHCIDTGEDPCGITLAKADMPISPQPARIQQYGNADFPVCPDSPICKLTPAQAGTAGTDIHGVEIPFTTPSNARPLELSIKNNAILTDNDSIAVSTTYGLVTIENGRIDVTPAFTVSDDMLSLSCQIFQTSFDNEPLTTDKYKGILNRLGFNQNFDAEAVKSALESLNTTHDISADEQETTSPVLSISCIAMTGTPATDGSNGYFEDKLAPSQKTEKKDALDSVDFHEVRSTRSVLSGQLLGLLHPPTDGIAGTSVDGETIAPTPGLPCEIDIGENVTINTETPAEIFADTDGVLIKTQDKIAVSDLLQIKGDVDYEVGNVHLEKGSVEIGGSIRTGFVVETPGNIVVNDSIEAATVIAGGDIIVQRGIVMQEQGLVRSAGNITAHFAENANIIAQGNISIDNDLTNSEVVARGKISCLQGKGKIMGGSIQAGDGLEANEIGSDLGVATHIKLGINDERLEALADERATLQMNLDKIEHIIGTATPEEILKKCPAEKRPLIAKVIKVQMASRQRLLELDKQTQIIMDQVKASSRTTIAVQKLIHPGVIIEIADSHLEIKKPHKHCLIYFDTERNEIRLGPLTSPESHSEPEK
jgi:uncharacterized protein (DUF342 family)